MADNIDHVSDSASDFEDSGDEGSFYGFENLENNDQFTDLCIPDFVEASGIKFQLPDNPRNADFFVAFVEEDLLDQIVQETNLYPRQKLADSPTRLANF